MRYRPRQLSEALCHLAPRARVVLLTGARQAGKSTLLRQTLEGRFAYRALDDLVEADRCRADPKGYLESLGRRAILDEAHTAPHLFPLIKNAVDHDPGLRFVLSGSSNLGLSERIREHLPGRSRLLELFPFSAREIEGSAGPGLLGLLCQRQLRGRILELASKVRPVARALIDRCLVWGSFPEPALSRGRLRASWFEGYIRLYLERDVRSLRAVADLGLFRRFMQLVAVRTAQTLNLSDIARELGISAMTASRYLEQLEATYQVLRLPPYYRNLGKRLVKSPKILWTDTGVANHLAGTQDLALLERLGRIGPIFETWVTGEVLKILRHGYPYQRMNLFHFRTGRGEEVDLVLEAGERLLPIEIKATRTPSLASARGLEKFLDFFPREAEFGILIYRGEEALPLTRRIFAIPINLFV